MMRGVRASVRGRTAGLRGFLGRRRSLRVGVVLVRDVPFLLPRHPRLALAIARAGRSKDPALLPLLDRALQVRRTPRLLRRQARILAATGEPTAERDVWRELANAGDRDAATRAPDPDRPLDRDRSIVAAADRGRTGTSRALDRRRILHITKSSVPERWSGFTIRTLQNMRAQRDAGLEPTVVTEIGWPRVVGVADVAPVVLHEGFEHHRLDPGPDYDLAGTPNDVRLQDTAEMMAPIVRALRPSILHAHSGYRGGDQALVALALRERFGIPVVYEVRGLFEAVWAEDPVMAERSELYARRLAQETRLMHAVDGVIAISEALADELSSRGIPRDKITVVPNGIDIEALGRPRPRPRPPRVAGVRGSLRRRLPRQPRPLEGRDRRPDRRGGRAAGARAATTSPSSSSATGRDVNDTRRTRAVLGSPIGLASPDASRTNRSASTTRRWTCS